MVASASTDFGRDLVEQKPRLVVDLPFGETEPLSSRGRTRPEDIRFVRQRLWLTGNGRPRRIMGPKKWDPTL